MYTSSLFNNRRGSNVTRARSPDNDKYVLEKHIQVKNDNNVGLLRTDEVKYRSSISRRTCRQTEEGMGLAYDQTYNLHKKPRLLEPPWTGKALLQDSGSYWWEDTVPRRNRELKTRFCQLALLIQLKERALLLCHINEAILCMNRHCSCCPWDWSRLLACLCTKGLSHNVY